MEEAEVHDGKCYDKSIQQREKERWQIYRKMWKHTIVAFYLLTFKILPGSDLVDFL